MANADDQLSTETVAHSFELEQTDTYSKYLLHSRTEILAVLRTMMQKGAMVTAHFDQGQSFLLTALLALTADTRGLILDIGSDDEMNQRALKTNRLILTTVREKVKIQFSLNGLTMTQHEGRPAFLAAVPPTLLRLQRREYFRLSTPIANPIRMTTYLRLDDGSQAFIELPLLDISGGGVGLMVSPEQAAVFSRGDELPDCHMLLPEEGLLVATLSVRNMFDVATRSGSRFVRIGCEFVDVPPARLNMVQRYITRIERERKARLSGMA